MSEQEQTTPDIGCCQGRIVPLDDAKRLWSSLCNEPAFAGLVELLYQKGVRLTYSAPEWIPYELLNQTREAWSRHYGRLVPFPEAVEILKPIRRLATTLAQTKGGKA